MGRRSASSNLTSVSPAKAGPRSILSAWDDPPSALAPSIRSLGSIWTPAFAGETD